MLRSESPEAIVFVTQPDHARASGYLAAHWGNRTFRPPGYSTPCADPERLRGETVFAVAEHDNGWWEWEASPVLSPEDDLPLGFGEAVRHQADAFERWRLGINRFADSHPYASLLIGWHAYWLTAPKAGADTPSAFLHPLFGGRSPGPAQGDDQADAAAFLAEIQGRLGSLSERVRARPDGKTWCADTHLFPHVRLLQLFDGLSLSVCTRLIPGDGASGTRLSVSTGGSRLVLADIPRAGWDDRVTLTVSPLGDGRIRCHPYPFDREPLRLTVPVRIVRPHDTLGGLSRSQAGDFQSGWHRLPMETLSVSFCAG